MIGKTVDDFALEFAQKQIDKLVKAQAEKEKSEKKVSKTSKAKSK